MTTRALLALTLILFSFPVYGEVEKGKLGIGLNYPGIGVRYFLSDKISAEFKIQGESQVGLIGLRGYHYFSTKTKSLLFYGLEVVTGFFSSAEGNSRGTLFGSEVFIGGEHFFTKKFSFQMDIGPAWIYLKDENYGATVNGIEYVVNFGINYYFKKKK